MTDSRQLALDYIKRIIDVYDLTITGKTECVVTALEADLAAKVEPVAYLVQPNAESHQSLQKDLCFHPPVVRNDWHIIPLYAAHQQAVPAWMPIDTAPKDGTHIMLSNGVSVSHGEFVDIPARSRVERRMEGHYIDQDEYDGYTGWMDYIGGMLPEPTHWMPLPEAPRPAA